MVLIKPNSSASRVRIQAGTQLCKDDRRSMNTNVNLQPELALWRTNVKYSNFTESHLVIDYTTKRNRRVVRQQRNIAMLMLLIRCENPFDTHVFLDNIFDLWGEVRENVYLSCHLIANDEFHGTFTTLYIINHVWNTSQHPALKGRIPCPR